MVEWSSNMSPKEKYEYRKEHRVPRERRQLPVSMGEAILRLKYEGRRKYGKGVVPLQGGVEVFLNKRGVLTIRKQHTKFRNGNPSRVLNALKECKGLSGNDFINCVQSKAGVKFMPSSWSKHMELVKE